jgi:hypothetical protein
LCSTGLSLTVAGGVAPTEINHRSSPFRVIERSFARNAGIVNTNGGLRFPGMSLVSDYKHRTVRGKVTGMIQQAGFEVMSVGFLLLILIGFIVTAIVKIVRNK